MSPYLCDWCRREHDALTPEDVKAIYSFVKKNGYFANGVSDVRHVEHALKVEITSTSEFHRLVNNYFAKQSGTKLTDGDRMKKNRKRAGLTQSKLARLLGVTKMAVCQYESGKRPLSKQALEWLNGENASLG